MVDADRDARLAGGLEQLVGLVGRPSQGFLDEDVDAGLGGGPFDGFAVEERRECDDRCVQVPRVEQRRVIVVRARRTGAFGALAVLGTASAAATTVTPGIAAADFRCTMPMFPTPRMPSESAFESVNRFKRGVGAICPRTGRLRALLSSSYPPARS